MLENQVELRFDLQSRIQTRQKVVISKATVTMKTSKKQHQQDALILDTVGN